MLEIRDLRMPRLYDLHWDKPRALVERRLRREVRQKIRPDGSVAVPLDAASVAAAIVAAMVRVALPEIKEVLRSRRAVGRGATRAGDRSGIRRDLP